MRLRLGAGALVLALHAAVAAFMVLGTRTAPVAAERESAMMVSVIDAPAPRQAPAQGLAQSLAPAAVPPADPEPRVRPAPEPQPIAQPSPLEPMPEQQQQQRQQQQPQQRQSKPQRQPKPQPQPRPRPKPQPATRPAPQEAANPSPEPPAASALQGRQQASQAPRQDTPVLVTDIQYDGPRPVPVYPRLSRLHDETGRVVVLVRISAQGKVQDASIDISSGHERLDDAALDAARRARFKPLTRNGVAMPALARLPYDFQMKD